MSILRRLILSLQQVKMMEMITIINIYQVYHLSFIYKYIKQDIIMEMLKKTNSH